MMKGGGGYKCYSIPYFLSVKTNSINGDTSISWRAAIYQKLFLKIAKLTWFEHTSGVDERQKYSLLRILVVRSFVVFEISGAYEDSN